MQSEQTNELDTALSKAQGAMKPAVFDKVNPHFKSKYASLASIFEAIRKPFAENGLSVTQVTKSNGAGGPVLITRLAHTTGQYITSEYQLPLGLNPQAMGSARTYARRQEISAVCGVVADEDDDANEATAAAKTATQKYGTTAEDIMENDLEYDTDGNVIDGIPPSKKGYPKMSKAMGKPEFAELMAKLKSAETLPDLLRLGLAMSDRASTLPDLFYSQLQDQYRTRQKELGWQPKATS